MNGGELLEEQYDNFRIIFPKDLLDGPIASTDELPVGATTVRKYIIYAVSRVDIVERRQPQHMHSTINQIDDKAAARSTHALLDTHISNSLLLPLVFPSPVREIVETPHLERSRSESASCCSE